MIIGLLLTEQKPPIAGNIPVNQIESLGSAPRLPFHMLMVFLLVVLASQSLRALAHLPATLLEPAGPLLLPLPPQLALAFLYGFDLCAIFQKKDGTGPLFR